MDLQTYKIVLFILAWVLLANISAILAMRLDKRFAQKNIRRIPEKNLLLLALVGGSPGAKLAQHRFRHKTRKQPFGLILNLIVVLHIAVVAFLMYSLAGLAEF